ncbi:MAG: DMT family transporter [Rickettsiales bacterium]|jgi:S-adenosylmethionine uptake transporter|nr:DMT family transporter [Rickettsiales bacterium]
MIYKLRTYFLGVTWFTLSLFSSAANNIIKKYLSLYFQSFEIIFFRFLFSTITLVPFIMYSGIQVLKTNNILIHIIKGILLFWAITFWNYGLAIGSITIATVISFSMPLFVLLLAVFFLNENIIWQRWAVTIIGFIGIVITFKPNSSNFDPKILVFIVSASFFAILDIVNKRLVVKESTIGMLFYSALITTIFASPMLLTYWQAPSPLELVLLFILGTNSNLILLLILKAFALLNATALAPYRYFELLISTTAAYFIFNEFPDKNTLYSALILVVSTLFIVCSEHKRDCK